MITFGNTSIGDVSYINCETKITVQSVPREWETFIKIYTKDKLLCQHLERPVATTSACALTILARPVCLGYAPMDSGKWKKVPYWALLDWPFPCFQAPLRHLLFMAPTGLPNHFPCYTAVCSAKRIATE